MRGIPDSGGEGVVPDTQFFCIIGWKLGIVETRGIGRVVVLHGVAFGTGGCRSINA